MKELDKVFGFGSVNRQKFDHCRRQYEKHANGKFTISMQGYIENLRKVCLTLERANQLDDELSATESHEFRGTNGYLQWVTKELLYPFHFVESFATEARAGSRSRLAQSK